MDELERQKFIEKIEEITGIHDMEEHEKIAVIVAREMGAPIANCALALLGERKRAR